MVKVFMIMFIFRRFISAKLFKNNFIELILYLRLLVEQGNKNTDFNNITVVHVNRL